MKIPIAIEQIVLFGDVTFEQQTGDGAQRRRNGGGALQRTNGAASRFGR